MNALDDEDAGFSLMETVIAMVIFALVAVATAGVLVKSASLTSDNRGRATASKLAAAQLDALRAAKYSDLISGSQVVQRSGKDFTMNTLVTPVFDDGSGGTRSCTSGGIGGELYKRVGVTVIWDNSNQVQQVRNDTIIQKSGAVDDTKGAIAVKVMDSGVGKSSPEPVTQQLVSLSTGETRYTDDEGCAFFDSLAPMTSRTVSVGRTGWVDLKDNAPATANVGVTAGIITASSLSFDNAFTPRLTFGPSAWTVGTTYRIPTGVKYSLVPQSGVNDATARKYTTLTSATPPVVGRWPQQSGYAAWMGTCTQATGDISTIDNTLPGVALNATVTTGGLTVTSTSSTTRTLTLVNQSSNCPTTPETLTVSIPSGTTRVAVPYGTWRYGGTITSLLGTPVTFSAAQPLQSVTW